uniref:Uncharacterized protein n=1 Tax=Amphimedon queenslandica TaxID=400682 RepID=A0A1X7UXW4_AMPQE
MSLQYCENIGDLTVDQYKDLPIDGDPWIDQPMDNESLINVSDYIQSKKHSFSSSSHEPGTCSSSEHFEILNQQNSHLSSSIVAPQQGQGGSLTLINDRNTQQQSAEEDEIGYYDTGQHTPTQSGTTAVDSRNGPTIIPEYFEDDLVLPFRGMVDFMCQPQSLMSCDETDSELSSSLLRVLKGTCSTQDTEEELMYCTETLMESHAPANSCWMKESMRLII